MELRRRAESISVLPPPAAARMELRHRRPSGPWLRLNRSRVDSLTPAPSAAAPGYRLRAGCCTCSHPLHLVPAEQPGIRLHGESGSRCTGRIVRLCPDGDLPLRHQCKELDDRVVAGEVYLLGALLVDAEAGVQVKDGDILGELVDDLWGTAERDGVPRISPFSRLRNRRCRRCRRPSARSRSPHCRGSPHRTGTAFS